MSREIEYRAKAHEVELLARDMHDPMSRQTLEQAARAWLLLANLEAGVRLPPPSDDALPPSGRWY